jgi:hypothetical protein
MSGAVTSRLPMRIERDHAKNENRSDRNSPPPPSSTRRGNTWSEAGILACLSIR